MPSPNPKFVEIYRARNLPQAHAIRIALEEAGIAVQVEGELLQGALGDLPIGWPTAPRILVEESQVPAAREIIEIADAQEVSQPGADDYEDENHCLACGAAMGDAAKCPACGWTFEGQEG
jgi:hypothetical protein